MLLASADLIVGKYFPLVEHGLNHLASRRLELSLLVLVAVVVMTQMAVAVEQEVRVSKL
tara:strand:+ start:44 stop:220 length:177 start_codon:yes stop_codon:yes gene_type:complete